jgi:hypothetical protein
MVKITLELEPNHAAALARLCEKFTHSDAQAYLYGHLSKEIRSDQAYDMVHATAVVSKALEDANVRGWPWVETGNAQETAT